jgi:hypothetical protein
VVQSHTCMQKVAWCHVRNVLPSGFRHYRGTQQTRRYQDGLVKSFADSLQLQAKYKCVTGSVLSRMRAVFEHHHDRVREITFEGTTDDFDESFKVTKRSFPMLEGLFLYFGCCGKSKVPDTFLGGPELSDQHLRCLTLYGIFFASISGLLSSVT